MDGSSRKVVRPFQCRVCNRSPCAVRFEGLPAGPDAERLGDRDLLDLLSLFRHGIEEMWENISEPHSHEGRPARDLRRDISYRIYMLRHHERTHQLLGRD